MQQRRESFPEKVRDKELYDIKREEMRADRHRCQEFAEQELKNPNLTNDFDSECSMWNDLCTETIFDDNE
jgi:hypothetical protein